MSDFLGTKKCLGENIIVKIEFVYFFFISETKSLLKIRYFVELNGNPFGIPHKAPW